MGTIRPGDLRDRLTIQRETRTPDGAGGFTTAWSDVGTVWAQAVPSGGQERLIAGSLRSKQGWTITIRWRGDVTNKDRFVLNDRALNIGSIEDPDRRRERLVALCETGG